MPQAQETKTPGRPWHLWLVGIVGGLWSVMGVVSFVLTQLNVAAAMGRFPPEQREYFTSFPWWSIASWGLGVACGLSGCLLLLLRNSLAPPVLLLALIGTAVSALGGLFLLDGLEVMRATDGLGLTLFPVVVGAGLAYYARAMRRQGVLR